MPQHEFELYLRLLSNLLDLEPSQREGIRDELRDHLEQRLAELSELGVPREQAIERALDEFGDAAGLAGTFTELARERQRNRRLFMYRTGTAVTVTLVLLAAFAFWPEGGDNRLVPPRAVAQPAQPPRAADAHAETKEGNDPFAGRKWGAANADRSNTVEVALAKPVPVHFEQAPFSGVIAFLADSIELDILIDRSALEDVGLDVAQPTDLVLQHAKPSARTVVELLLEYHGVDGDIALVSRDGFAQITSIDHEALEVEVYDVRDLVAPARGAGGPFGPANGGGDAFGEQGAAAAGGARIGFAQFGGGGGLGGGFEGGGIGGGRETPPPVEGIEGLRHVVETTVAPGTWERHGGNGTIAAFDGMLVVANSADVHRQVRSLLEKLRLVRTGGVGKPQLH